MRTAFFFLFSAALQAANLADAVQKRDGATVAALLKANAGVNAAQGDGMTALHWAAYHDDVALIRQLLVAKADLTATTRVGKLTPLFLAAKNGSAGAVAALAQFGANVNTPNDTGTTPLMMAAASGSTEAVEALLRHGADVNLIESTNGQTALMFAAALNRDSVVKLLLAKGADHAVVTKTRKLERLRVDMDGNVIPVREGAPAAPAGEGEAAQQANGNSRRAGDVANLGPREAGITEIGGMTALLFASRDGHIAAAKALLDGGANVNLAGKADRTSPLVLALTNGHYDLAKVLIDHGADVNLANAAGLAPLFATIDVQWAPKAWYPQPDTTQQQNSYLDILKALLAKGANPNAKLEKKLWFRGLAQDPVWVDAKGATPFWRAAQSSDITAMKLLVAAGADPKIANAQGATPLMVAAGIGWMANHSTNSPDGWMPAVAYCLSLGLDVNATDQRGYTPLHGAAYIGSNEIVKLLVEKGANVKAKTKAGDTVADMANGPTRFGLPHPETLALLEKLGSENSHNCRSDQCLVAPRKEPPAATAAKPVAK
jgi:ankyrin repeat protein